MSTQPSTTSILFFSNSVEVEARRKHLLSGNKNKDLLKALRRKTLNTLHESGLPVFEFTEKQQHGEHFGERITHAFQEVLSLGFEQLICVGSDCPDLSLKHIHRACDSLNTNELVLGPDFRGGVFLIGLKKQAFDPALFINLKWNSKELISSFIADHQGYDIHFLEPNFDINHGVELLKYAIQSPILQRLLKLVIRLTEHAARPVARFHLLEPLRLDYLRGPPQMA